MRRITLSLAVLAYSSSLASCTHEPPPQPARIVSGSMAERFYGEHWAVACGDCGFAFRCGVEHPPDRMLAICPNCGYRENEVDEAAKQPGLAVEVVPRDFVKAPPRRWEVIAYREAQGDHVAVKRVAGLPGERVAIRGGDLFVNGARVKKSLEEFLTQSQQVYDDAHRPGISPDLPARWQPANAASGWAPFENENRHGYRYARGAVPTASPDWLEYHHWSCAATPTPRTDAAPIRDNDAYNQGLSRAMNSVSDVALSFNVQQLSDGDELLVRLYDGAQPLAVSIVPNLDEVRILHGERTYDSAPAFLPLISSRDWNVTVAVVDGQLHVALGGVPTLTIDLDADGIQRAPRDLALAIGAQNVNVEITDLQVLRDLYYLNPLGRPGDWQMAQPLGQGEFFVLGDNPPLSRDSRQSGSIAIEQLVGSVRIRAE